MAVAAEALNIEEQVPAIEHHDITDGRLSFDRSLIEQEARNLINNREQLERSSILQQEYHDNARTALMEALTASGHLSRVELTGDIDTIHGQVLSRLLAGWDETLPAHEQERRFAELCNFLFIRNTHRAIVAGELPADTAVLEISDYPEPLVGTRLGYRHSNKKGMVRSTHLMALGNGQYSLLIEQVSRSNGTWPSTYQFLANCQLRGLEDSSTPDLVALNIPLMYRTGNYGDGVIDIMRPLDKYAGNDVLYGDEGTAKRLHVDYAELRQESARREHEIEHYITGLAKLEQQLDGLVERGVITKAEQLRTFKDEVDRILTAICSLQPAYAEATFGEKAAPLFHQAAGLIARGQQKQAEALLISAQNLKETITFCGMEISLEKAQEMGLEVNSLGQLIEEGKKNWKWKQGVCRVKKCPTRPGKTKVGPCEVCVRCQASFDSGHDPTR